MVGYARLKENVTNGKADNHEGIDFYRPVENPDKTKPLWGENQWPAVSGFKEKYEAWVEKMKKLGLIVMEACVVCRSSTTLPNMSHRMATGLGMSPEEWAQLRSQVDDSFWVMRVIGTNLGHMLSFERYSDLRLQGTLRYPTITMGFPADPTKTTVASRTCHSVHGTADGRC